MSEALRSPCASSFRVEISPKRARNSLTAPAILLLAKQTQVQTPTTDKHSKALQTPKRADPERMLMAQDAYSFVTNYHGQLGNMNPAQRRRHYTTDEFPVHVESCARAFKTLGVPSDLIASLVNAGMEMRTESQRLGYAQLQSSRTVAIPPFSYEDTNDTFQAWFNTLIDAINQGINDALAKAIMSKIDADFAEPSQRLAETISDEQKEPKALLLRAITSFKQGRKEESSVLTRKAWEATVTYALSRLPKKKDLDSLQKKTVFVLEQMGLKDESESITKIKNVYEGRFLHFLDSEEALPEPELPFYIALAIGLVLLIDRHFPKG